MAMAEETKSVLTSAMVVMSSGGMIYGRCLRWSGGKRMKWVEMKGLRVRCMEENEIKVWISLHCIPSIVKYLSGILYWTLQHISPFPFNVIQLLFTIYILLLQSTVQTTKPSISNDLR
ncbi:hypothetical protein DM860_003034 [Cuscuta australis]|uniref:Uncharacterized protein n=1 Tax=Cuscuta australis TaxID=267555 RepID=A0A328D504_9ASTE|nr:hypothetical protein DM860_003034 [Cuscuta australis]